MLINACSFVNWRKEKWSRKKPRVVSKVFIEIVQFVFGINSSTQEIYQSVFVYIWIVKTMATFNDCLVLLTAKNSYFINLMEKNLRTLFFRWFHKQIKYTRSKLIYFMALKYREYGCVYERVWIVYEYGVSTKVTFAAFNFSFNFNYYFFFHWFDTHTPLISFVPIDHGRFKLYARLVRSLLFFFLILFHFILFFYVSLFFQFISIYDFEIVMCAQRYANVYIILTVEYIRITVVHM